MIELGQKVRDKITGYEGVVTGRSVWLTGCATCGIQARIDKDGKRPELEWFDEIRLEVVDEDIKELDRIHNNGGEYQYIPKVDIKGI